MGTERSPFHLTSHLFPTRYKQGASRHASSLGLHVKSSHSRLPLKHAGPHSAGGRLREAARRGVNKVGDGATAEGKGEGLDQRE